MRTPLTIGSATAGPGCVSHGKLACEPYPDGGEAFVAVTLINGASDGPALWIGSTIHGREVPGIEVIRRLAQRGVDPAALRGAIICGMPLNPYGFQARQHLVPQDGGNVNAAFPGNREGTLSERQAWLLCTQGLRHCDYVLDFHANEPGGIEFTCTTPCADRDVQRRSIEMAEAFGFPLVQIQRDMWGYDHSLIAWAQDAGKPAILPEPLCQGVFDSSSIEAALRGVLNVAVYAGMLEGEVQPQSTLKLRGGHHRFVNVRTNKGGLADYLVEGGDWVEAEQELAVIRDPWGDTLDTVVSPTRACVRSTSPSSVVNAGQIVVTLLEPHEREELWGS